LATRDLKPRPAAGEPATLASAAYERLRREIIVGTFPAGRKLHIRRLCERYQMGLSPVREALNRVSRDGLVRQNDLRGFSVAPMSLEDLTDLTATRCWLNELALRQAIADGDAAWEEGIVLAFHRFSRSPQPEPGASEAARDAHESAHRAFHASLIAACGSARLRAYCEQLFDAADRYRNLKRPHQLRERRKHDEHRVIMDAVLARDAAKAVGLLNAHFRGTERIAAEALRREKPARQPSRDQRAAQPK
jgi:GntR family transcriptional regulator, carbon starvation induced regulator